MDKPRCCWQRGASTCCHRVPRVSPSHPQAQFHPPGGPAASVLPVPGWQPRTSPCHHGQHPRCVRAANPLTSTGLEKSCNSRIASDFLNLHAPSAASGPVSSHASAPRRCEVLLTPFIHEAPPSSSTSPGFAAALQGSSGRKAPSSDPPTLPPQCCQGLIQHISQLPPSLEAKVGRLPSAQQSLFQEFFPARHPDAALGRTGSPGTALPSHGSEEGQRIPIVASTTELPFPYCSLLPQPRQQTGAFSSGKATQTLLQLHCLYHPL